MPCNFFKTVELTPTEVLAGDSVQFVISLMIAEQYTPGPSRVIFDLPAQLGTSRPTQRHHEDGGFIRARVSNPHVEYTLRIWNMQTREFMTRESVYTPTSAGRMCVLDLSEGLKQGDRIEFHWGASEDGFGTGAKVTTVVPKLGYAAVIHVRYFDSQEKGLPDYGRSIKGIERPEPTCEVPLSFTVHPRELHHLRLVRKTDKAILLPLDRFCNVRGDDDPSDLVEAEEQPTRSEAGTLEYRDKDINLRSKGAELLETPGMSDVFDGYNLYWGDIHTHSSISGDCIQREKLQMTPDDLMTFARLRAGLDFYAVTDHHNPHSARGGGIPEASWSETIRAVKAHDKPGEFLALPGIEYSDPRGDTAVVFGWLPSYDEIDSPEWTDIREMWKDLEGKDYLSIAHFHQGGRLEPDEWWRGPDEVEPVLEIFSCHGSYETLDPLEQSRGLIKNSRPDRTWVYFLQRGLRYGFVCNSDGHKGHVGYNGVTAVFSKTLDKESIFRAYRERRVYGTTNARIRLIFTANGNLMGSVLPDVAKKTFGIDVVGENALKKVDLFRNGELYKRFVGDGKTFQTDMTVSDDGPANWYVRATQLDDHIAWSSPIWFE